MALSQLACHIGALLVLHMYVSEASLQKVPRCLADNAYFTTPCKPEVPTNRTDPVNFNLTCILIPEGYRCQVLDPVSFKYRVEAHYVPRQPNPNIQNLWVGGKGPGFSDSNLIEMRSSGVAGIWSTDIEYKVDIQCSTLSPCPKGPLWDLELTIYKGADKSADRTLGPSFHYRLPMSGMVSGSHLFDVPLLKVFPTFSGLQVAVRDHSIRLSQAMAASLGMDSSDSDPDIRYSMVVMYPPSFEDNQLKRYRLVLVLGTDVVRMLPGTFEYMLREESSVEEAVLVGLSYPTGINCMILPQLSREYECKEGLCGVSCQTCRDPSRKASTACSEEEFVYEQVRCGRSKWCGGKADAFINLIRNSILPSLRELLQERILIHPKSSPLAIMGYHHGGLFACYAAMKHPELFKNAACLSPSLYAPLVDTYEYSLLDLVKEKAQLRPESSAYSEVVEHFDQTIYFEVGQNDMVHFPVYQSNDTVRAVMSQLEAIGLELNKNMFLTITEGASSYDLSTSEEVAFYDRIVRPLQLFLHPSGNPNVNNIVSPAVANSIPAEELPQWRTLSQGPTQADRPHVDTDRVLTIEQYTVRNIPGSKLHYSACEQKHITVAIFVVSLLLAVLVSVVLTIVCLCVVENTLTWSGKKKKGKKSDSDGSSEDDSDESIASHHSDHVEKKTSGDSFFSYSD